MLFPNGKEFELWYHALQRAASISANARPPLLSSPFLFHLFSQLCSKQISKYQQEDAKVHSYFSQYHKLLMGSGKDSFGLRYCFDRPDLMGNMDCPHAMSRRITRRIVV